MELLFLVLLFRAVFSLHEKCTYHSSSFWLCKLIPWMKPNWKNRYSNVEELKVKWWAWVLPFDGPHLFKQLMVFVVLNLAYFGIDASISYVYFMLGLPLILIVIHVAIMQRSRDER